MTIGFRPMHKKKRTDGMHGAGIHLAVKIAAYNIIYFTGNSNAYDAYNSEDSIVNVQELQQCCTNALELLQPCTKPSIYGIWRKPTV